MYYEIVSLQGEDFNVLGAICDTEGYDSGVDYLTQWDDGDGALDRALFYGYVYDSIDDAFPASYERHELDGYIAGINYKLGTAVLIKEA